MSRTDEQRTEANTQHARPLDDLLARKRKALGEDAFRPRNRWRRRLIWGAVAAAALLALAYITGLLGNGQAGEPVEPVDEGPPPIVSATGPVVPERRASLSFVTSGRVRSIDVRPGDEVQRGQLLAQLEPSSVPASMPGSAVSSGAADLYITAPFDGVVGSVLVNEWETVQPGSPVVVLGDLSRLRVELEDLSETDVGRLREGQEAEISFEAFPDRVEPGRVARISPMNNDRGGGVNYDVVIEFVGADLSGLRWGMTAHVDILVGEGR